MGLDLHAGEHAWHASYSGLQMHRIHCILAFAKVLKDNFPGATKTLGAVISCLPPLAAAACAGDHGMIEGFLAGRMALPRKPDPEPGAGMGLMAALEDTTPNYKNIKRLRMGLAAPGAVVKPLRGLEAWVNHSDCDGRHTPAQARKVLDMLDFIMGALPQDEPWDKKWHEDLRALYAHATEKKRVVEFC